MIQMWFPAIEAKSRRVAPIWEPGLRFLSVQ